jgi:hypothetical protein
MASKSVTVSNPTELFSLNGSYLVHPDTTQKDLLEDAHCWLSAAIATVNEVAIGLTSGGSDMLANPREAGKMIWGVFHALEMVDGAIRASFSAPEETA